MSKKKDKNPKFNGRPPEWLKQKCQSMISRHGIIDFLARVASGQETEEKSTKDGIVTIHVGASDRLKAAEMLLDRGFGKPAQSIGFDGDGAPLVINFIPAQKNAATSDSSPGH